MEGGGGRSKSHSSKRTRNNQKIRNSPVVVVAARGMRGEVFARVRGSSWGGLLGWSLPAAGILEYLGTHCQLCVLGGT